MTHTTILNDAFKRFTLDQDKIFSPEETVRRFKEKLKKVDLDILEYTVRIDNGRLGIPVYFSSCGKDAMNTIGTKKQMGKGATPKPMDVSIFLDMATNEHMPRKYASRILPTNTEFKNILIKFSMITYRSLASSEAIPEAR